MGDMKRSSLGRATLAGLTIGAAAAMGCRTNHAGGGDQANKAPSGQFQQRETGMAPATGTNGGDVAGADSANRGATAQPPTNATSPNASTPSPGQQVARAPRGNPGAGAPPATTPAGGDTAKNRSGTAAPPTPKAGGADTSTAAVSSAPLRDAYHQPPNDTVSQVVYTGWKQFNLNCARCHGEDVTGTTIAPYLIDSFKSGKVDHTEFWNVVHGSRMQKGMPNWSGVIADDNLEAIYQYIKGRSEGKIHPGRPAVQGG
jgi:mono/diheme cytochrome c family protein